jgi:hypothetical protein
MYYIDPAYAWITWTLLIVGIALAIGAVLLIRNGGPRHWQTTICGVPMAIVAVVCLFASIPSLLKTYDPIGSIQAKTDLSAASQFEELRKVSKQLDRHFGDKRYGFIKKSNGGFVFDVPQVDLDVLVSPPPPAPPAPPAGVAPPAGGAPTGTERLGDFARMSIEAEGYTDVVAKKLVVYSDDGRTFNKLNVIFDGKKGGADVSDALFIVTRDCTEKESRKWAQELYDRLDSIRRRHGLPEPSTLEDDDTNEPLELPNVKTIYTP